MGYDEYTGVLKCGEGIHQSDWKLLLSESHWVLLGVCTHLHSYRFPLPQSANPNGKTMTAS